MTCMEITESQNAQIYPEDTFSNGAAHMYLFAFGNRRQPCISVKYVLKCSNAICEWPELFISIKSVVVGWFTSDLVRNYIVGVP